MWWTVSPTLCKEYSVSSTPNDILVNMASMTKVTKFIFPPIFMTTYFMFINLKPTQFGLNIVFYCTLPVSWENMNQDHAKLKKNQTRLCITEKNQIISDIAKAEKTLINKLGLNCAKLKLNWASMLRLLLNKICILKVKNCLGLYCFKAG